MGRWLHSSAVRPRGEDKGLIWKNICGFAAARDPAESAGLCEREFVNIHPTERGITPPLAAMR